MKTMIFSILVLSSTIAFAQVDSGNGPGNSSLNCKYAIESSFNVYASVGVLSSGRSLELRQEAVAMTKEILSEKGYVYSPKEAMLKLKLFGGYRKYDLAEGSDGFSSASAELRTDKSKLFYAKIDDGGAGYFFGIGKKDKALNRLKKILESMPNCEEL